MKLRFGIYRNNPIILLHPTDSNFNDSNDNLSDWRYSCRDNSFFVMMPEFEDFCPYDFATVQGMDIIEYQEYDDDDDGEEIKR